jgi:hypothetical protein
MRNSSHWTVQNQRLSELGEDTEVSNKDLSEGRTEPQAPVQLQTLVDRAAGRPC